MSRLTAATKAFQKPDIITNPLDLDAEFNSWDGRRVRYDINWAFYENTVYIEAVFRNWVKNYKTQFGLNKYIRSIYSPGYRLGEFWKAHLWAGPIIPLEFPDHVDEGLMAAIHQIWKWSNWEINKDIVPLYGSVMGDVGILIVDDTEKEKVYFDVIHPGNIVAVEKDTMGNIKGYELQEERDDPRQSAKELLANETNKTVTYSEIAFRDNDNVVYTTLLDGKPYPWNGQAASWSKPYGFVPMVLIQHNNVGGKWGWSEIHPGQSKFREVDDQASKLNDQIRKMVDSPWVYFGVAKPETSPTTTETALTGAAAVNRPQPGREEVPAIYGPEGGSAQALVSDLNIADVAANILQLIEEIERDYPELRLLALMDDTSFGNISGRALRMARQPSETKVRQRRPGYYNALVRANQMAVFIAGLNGYDGFSGFGPNSFDEGLLDHSIGKMPIFAVDPLDDLELSKETATITKMYTDAGAGIEQAALRAGMSEDEAAALSQRDLGIVER